MLGQEADRRREGPSLAPAGGLPLSLTSPLSSFSPSPRQPVNQVPWASKGPQRVTFFFSFLIQAFILSCVDSCNNLLPHLPASISSLPPSPPQPPPRSQGTSLTTLLGNAYGKGQTLQHGIQPRPPFCSQQLFQPCCPLFFCIYPMF